MKLPRVYALLDGAVLAARGVALLDAARALLDGGVRMLQLRWKDHFSPEVFGQAELVAQACRDAGALFVLNDRADFALLLGSGLHVGQDDLPPAEARRVIGPDALLGYSTHNERQLLAALSEPIDYVAIGPVFATSTKVNPDPVVGCKELARLCPECRIPVVAIGGITLDRAREVWDSGASVAAITADLYPAHCTTASIRRRAEEWTRLANEYDRTATI